MNIRIDPATGVQTITLTKTERSALTRARDLVRALGHHSEHCKLIAASLQQVQDAISETGVFVAPDADKT